MWLSNLAAAWLLGISITICAIVCATGAEVGCPPFHNGKKLKDVGLFDGDPADHVESIPEPGRFVVPQDPPSPGAKIPNYTLGCFYEEFRKGELTVVLPRYIKVCEFTHYPYVRCH